MNITTPANAKVRTRSNRRYIVIRETVEADRAPRAEVEKRTDSIQTARQHVSRKGQSFAPDMREVRMIFDAVESRFV